MNSITMLFASLRRELVKKRSLLWTTNGTSETSSVISDLMEKAISFGDSFSSLPFTDEDAIRKLKIQGLTDNDISQRGEAFALDEKISKPAALANYELLHGIRELDKASIVTEEYDFHTETIIAIYRSAEVCLYNLAVLTEKMVKRIEANEIGEASCDARWCRYFQDTLHKLSQLIIEFDRGSVDGDYLDIHDSPSYIQFQTQIEELHKVMQTTWVEPPEYIEQNDLDDPQRYIFFNEYVNVNYQRIWTASLEHIRLPSIKVNNGEDKASFFKRIVSTDNIRKAVDIVDLKHATNLMQFRAYHQMSEVFVKHINKWCCRVVVQLLSQDDNNLDESVRVLTQCNKLLWMVNDNVKPITRALSPNAYFAIRPALGITSGSHSYNLRKGLFNTVYPLIVKAIRLKVLDYDVALLKNDEEVYTRCKAILNENPHSDLAEVIRQIVYIHQHVRLWRDDHIQFIKTQIGISPEDDQPMASISGSANASAQAHQFRSVHERDLIIPLYKAVLGKPPAPTHELVQKGGFDEFMARQTAQAANQMYPDIQHRVRDRKK